MIPFFRGRMVIEGKNTCARWVACSWAGASLCLQAREYIALVHAMGADFLLYSYKSPVSFNDQEHFFAYTFLSEDISRGEREFVKFHVALAAPHTS